MRSLLGLLAFAVPQLLSAQITEAPPRPWPCPVPPPCRQGEPCVMRSCGIVSPDVVRQSSDVRVNLIDGVLRYEITETFVNRGSRLGEADFMFPLPNGAAVQEITLSITDALELGY